MLQEITVKNLALIEEIHLEFNPSFNVLTGETGAGKSIIIDALGLALGGRFSAEMIRTGAETAVVDAAFLIGERPELRDYLSGIGIQIGADNMLIIQREISNAGKNRCRVNGQLVTVLSLTKIGEFLIDIHGQHEHQSLLFPEKQLELLDQYAGADCIRLRNEVNQVYKEWHSLNDEYHSLQQNEADLARKVDLLQFQINEINQAKLVIGEDEDLLKEREVLAASERLYEAASQSYRALHDDSSGSAAIELLGAAERTLAQVAAIDLRLAPILETLREAACQAEEVSRELRSYQDQVQFDPARLAEIDERLDEIIGLKRKYGANIGEVLLFAEHSQQELAGIANREERSAQLEAELVKVKARLGELAVSLSGERQSAAQKLEADIVNQLNDLNMAQTQFKITLSQAESSVGVEFQGRTLEVAASGIDKIEYLVAPNPGEGLKPMVKIASGGELSRIMLALKSILADLDAVPTMVFDEIDVGIGGRTAQAVAEKILLIGQSRQVLCVTHLPQIASLARRHFYIEKHVVQNRTEVTVRELPMNERVEELARMLGGAQVTDTTRQHAQEMLMLAEKLRLNKVGHVTKE
ncbi:MAG TPA: DNA repair protein RecN [Firmicutes bacterium]|nr:DNA repair protein RecN [Bacillota bacterium]